MRGLYAIVDVISLQQRGLEPLRFAEAVLAAGPAVVQLRDKRLRAAETLALLCELRSMCQAAGVPLYMNDRADLAALAKCDGLHVGQGDLPYLQARALASWGSERAKVGVSLHNSDQLNTVLESHEQDLPDYLAFGPVFTTSSKAQPDPVLGLETLDELLRQAASSGLPTVAIGGIDHARASDVAARCSCVAVISALYPEADLQNDARYTRVTELTTELIAHVGAAQ